MKIHRRFGQVATFLAAASATVPTVSRAAETGRNGIWAQVYATDPAAFAVNLRAAGFPEGSVGVLVSQQIDSLFVDRERELMPSTRSTEGVREFWSPGVREEWLELQKEKRDRLRAALGTAPDQQAQSDWIALVYPHLATIERAALRTTTQDYDQLEDLVRAESRGHLLDEDLAMLAFLQAERVSDLRRVLSDDEVIDYMIRRTRLGSWLRQSFEAWDATPAEMRLCYRLAAKHGLEIDIQKNGPLQIDAGMSAVERDLVGHWPAERIRALHQARTHAFQSSYHLALRLGLDREAAQQVHDSYLRMSEAAQKEIEQQSTSPQQITPTSNSAPHPPPSPADATALPRKSQAQSMAYIKELLRAHLAEVLSVLGEKGQQAYCEMNQYWITLMAEGYPVVMKTY